MFLLLISSVDVEKMTPGSCRSAAESFDGFNGAGFNGPGTCA